MDAVKPYKLGAYRTTSTPKKKKSNTPNDAMANMSPSAGLARHQFEGFGAIRGALLLISAMATSS